MKQSCDKYFSLSIAWHERIAVGYDPIDALNAVHQDGLGKTKQSNGCNVFFSY